MARTDSSSAISVVFLIPSLAQGGAERQLVELVKRIDKTRFVVTVVTFCDGGAFQSAVANTAGVTLLSLDKNGRWDAFPYLWRLCRLTRRVHPSIMVGYLDWPAILCLGAGLGVGAKVVWSLRSSVADFGWYGWGTRLSFYLGAILSRFASLIIFNSNKGKEHYLAHGYANARMLVIPNGIDSDRFCPMPEERRKFRNLWGIAQEEAVIGFVGRLDPMKDHPTFLHAAANLTRINNKVRFVCVGDGPAPYAAQLQSLSRDLGLEQHLIWAGAQTDMSAVYNCFDVFTSSSVGEGFSNVIGEAMACGVPCVVTDVGDSAIIVGSTGTVVPPRDSTALAEAWNAWLNMDVVERRTCGQNARARIECHFNLQAMVGKTEEALRALLESSERS